MKYFDALQEAMSWLNEQEDTVFIGQAVEYPGTATFNTLTEVKPYKKYELPVFEDTQLGLSIGLALTGFIPISIFPRLNFLLCATNQLINHLDKLKLMSDGEYQPKIIIRTVIGSEIPLDPQEQHKYDYTDALRQMCKTINVVRLDNVSQIIPEYQKAYNRIDGISTLLVEWGDKYNE